MAGKIGPRAGGSAITRPGRNRFPQLLPRHVLRAYLQERLDLGPAVVTQELLVFEKGAVALGTLLGTGQGFWEISRRRKQRNAPGMSLRTRGRFLRSTQCNAGRKAHNLPCSSVLESKAGVRKVELGSTQPDLSGSPCSASGWARPPASGAGSLLGRPRRCPET